MDQRQHCSPVVFPDKVDGPACPATRHGQTIFLLTAMQNSDPILESWQRLQYGPSAAGGGSFWSVVSWYQQPSTGTIIFTAPVQVSPGQPLNGDITIIGVTGANFNYLASFPDIPGTRITVSNVPRLERATIGLAAFNIAAKSDYPNTATTQFSSISVQTLNTTGTPFVF
ncbi:hypothetical protein C8J57DRAFT_1570872 [Mycena rebaudengoi]|nr:hypothetical protein C8J57DRAFT_1570872 [Mycena rebaudengoi]